MARITAPQHCCPLHLNKQAPTGRVQCDAMCRFCCKSLFALVIKNSLGRRRDFRVKMWGTSSPDDKLTGDLGNVIEAMSIDGRGSDCLAAGKLAPGNLGLLQQYLPGANIAAPLMSNACEGNSAVAALSQNLPNLREKLTRAVRLRYKIIAARCSGFLFISAQGI
jgi:hypothetical protein